MNLSQIVQLNSSGTSEGARKGWDTRGRGRKATPSDVPQSFGKIKRQFELPTPVRPVRLIKPQALREGVGHKTIKDPKALRRLGLTQRDIRSINYSLWQLTRSQNTVRQKTEAGGAIVQTLGKVKSLPQYPSWERAMESVKGVYHELKHRLLTLPARHPDVTEAFEWFDNAIDWVMKVIHHVPIPISGTGLEAYGTPEGVRKAWDTRGRGHQQFQLETRPHVIRMMRDGKGRRPVALDFDNTISEHVTGTGLSTPGRLIPEALELIRQLKQDGRKIVIFTTRPRSDWAQVERFVLANHLPIDGLTNEKFHASAYIDDHAIEWTRDTQRTVAKVREMAGSFGLVLAVPPELQAGGPGSGCNPRVGHCGRPPGTGEWKGKDYPGSSYGWVPHLGVQTDRYYKDVDGRYLPSRLGIHNYIVNKYENKPKWADPHLMIVAGGTASGKTVNAQELFKQLRSPAIVNMDMPRAILPEFKKVVGTTGTGLLQEESSDIRDAILRKASAHNNDIALDAVGSPGLSQKLDALEKAGYKVDVAYVHRPVEESIVLADRRSKNATTAVNKRLIPETVTRASHVKARTTLPMMMKPGRDVKIYDGTDKWSTDGKMVPYDLIYHRTADGKVLTYDHEAVRRMANSEEPKIPLDAF